MPRKPPPAPCELCEDPTKPGRENGEDHPGFARGRKYEVSGLICRGCAKELDREYAARPKRKVGHAWRKSESLLYRRPAETGPPPPDIARRIAHYAGLVAAELDPWESSPYRVGREALG